jgi:hypothetical protein
VRAALRDGLSAFGFDPSSGRTVFLIPFVLRRPKAKPEAVSKDRAQ